MPAGWSPKAPTSSTSARNRPAPMAARSRCRRGGTAAARAGSARRSSALGVPVSIDTMKAAVAAWALDAGRRHRQRRLGPAARPRHGARGRRARRAGHRHAQPRRAPIPRSTSWPTSRRSSPARSTIADARRHRARAVSCSIPASASARRRSKASPRSRGCAEFKSLRPAAPDRRVAQALHRQGLALPPPDRRLGGSIAAHLLAVANGAAIVRVHDVAETVQALRVAAAIRERTMSDTIFVTGSRCTPITA